MIAAIALSVIQFVQSFPAFSPYTSELSDQWKVEQEWTLDDEGTYRTQLVNENIFEACTSKEQYIVFPSQSGQFHQITIDGIGTFTNSPMGKNYIPCGRHEAFIPCEPGTKAVAHWEVLTKTAGYTTITAAPFLGKTKLYRILFRILNFIIPGAFLALAIVAIFNFRLLLAPQLLGLLAAQNFFFFIYFMSLECTAIGLPITYRISSVFCTLGLWGGLWCFYQILSRLYDIHFIGTYPLGVSILLSSLAAVIHPNLDLLYIALLGSAPFALLVMGHATFFLVKKGMFQSELNIINVTQALSALGIFVSGNADLLSSIGYVGLPLSLCLGFLACQVIVLIEFYKIAKKQQDEKLAIASGLRKSSAEANLFEQRVTAYRTVLHDIKSPMGLLKVLITDTTQPFSRELATKALKRIENIFDRSTESRILMAQPTPLPEVLTLIERAVESKERELAQYRGLHLSFTGPNEEGPSEGLNSDSKFSRGPGHIICQPEVLEEILSNLLNNSAQACNYKGKVRVSAVVVDTHLKINIEDQGLGFPEVVLENLGNIGMTYRKNDGSGIGLNQSIASIAGWGGELTVSSAQNPTIVTVQLKVENT